MCSSKTHALAFATQSPATGNFKVDDFGGAGQYDIWFDDSTYAMKFLKRLFFTQPDATELAAGMPEHCTHVSRSRSALLTSPVYFNQVWFVLGQFPRLGKRATIVSFHFVGGQLTQDLHKSIRYTTTTAAILSAVPQAISIKRVSV